MTDAKKAYISDGVNWLPLVSSLPNMDGYATEDYVNIKIDQVENIILPDQYGNDGKFLSTDGTNASWEVIDLSPYATQSFASNAAATASAAAVTYLVDSAPATLDTLNELAAALNDDANFASTVTTALGNKLDASSASTTYATKTELNEKPSTGKSIAMAIVFGG